MSGRCTEVANTMANVLPHHYPNAFNNNLLCVCGRLARDVNDAFAHLDNYVKRKR